MAHRHGGAAPKTGRSKKSTKKPPARPVGPDVDSLGFQAMDSNVPGLSRVILQKLNMKSYDDYKSAMDGRKKGSDFGIRTYFDMFQKMEDTFKFCVECKKLPDALPDPKSLRRCKRCQNVYYCGVACQRANWPLHKKFCKKLKLVAIDRLVEWLVFTGDIPFPTETWTKPVQDVKGWEDWFAMQGQLEEKLGAILGGRYMTLLWANAGKPRPEEGELCESVKRLVTDFHSRPVTIGLGLQLFGLEPLARPLTVHVVGASHVETLSTRVTDYDELTRMFPGHQGMEVVMVGADVVDGPIMRPPLAAPAPGGKVYLSSYKGLYHDFWEDHVETQRAARPDLVVGFHPGFHACPDLMEGWLPTLLLLRDYRLPTLFTVYNEQELKASLQILAELEARVAAHAANPFASRRPEQVYSSPNKAPVYCSAYYIALLGPAAPGAPCLRGLEEDGGD
ncbi:Y7331 protein, partial [Dromaius novaehollandiae]|nr:Y7331 protein [Dromaius novaehollandiae]